MASPQVVREPPAPARDSVDATRAPQGTGPAEPAASGLLAAGDDHARDHGSGGGGSPGPATGMVGGVRAPQRQPDVEVRLHAPLPQVVIVRVAGTVAGSGVGLVAERVAQQLGRAANVVLDLDEVRVLDTDGVNVVLDLHRQAIARGVRLHVAGADHEAVSAPLRLTGVVDELPDLAPCADAVVARLRRPDPTGGPAGGPRSPGWP